MGAFKINAIFDGLVDAENDNLIHTSIREAINGSSPQTIWDFEM